MKRTIWLFGLGLLLYSCDSIDQPAASGGQTAVSNESDALAITESHGPDASKLGKQTKSGVCHYSKDAGTYSPISVAAPALKAHFAHGDSLVGGGVPHMLGYAFDANCQPELLACPCWTFEELNAREIEWGWLFIDPSGEVKSAVLQDGPRNIESFVQATPAGNRCSFIDESDQDPNRLVENISDAVANACELIQSQVVVAREQWCTFIPWPDGTPACYSGPPETFFGPFVTSGDTL